MAIQFFCPACRQPIEIDDDAGGQPVTCPYCQKVVTAPPQSDPTFKYGSPVGGTTSSQPIAPLDQIPPLPAGNKLGWIALAMSGVFLVCMLVAVFLASYYSKGLPPNTTPAEAAKIINEKMRTPALMAFSLFASCAVPVVGLACAIGSLVRKRRPLWPGIVSLIVFVAFAFLICAGLLFSASQAANKAG